MLQHCIEGDPTFGQLVGCFIHMRHDLGQRRTSVGAFTGEAEEK